MVKLEQDTEGNTLAWDVDDCTLCFYKTLAKCDADVILFEHCEVNGMNGYLSINRKDGTFTQYSILNGEWLKLFGTFNELTNT